MTAVEAWTLALVLLSGTLQIGGLAWAWVTAKRNSREAHKKLEKARIAMPGTWAAAELDMEEAGESGMTWDEHDYAPQHEEVRRAGDALAAYKVQGIMVLAGLLLGMGAGALPLIASGVSVN